MVDVVVVVVVVGGGGGGCDNDAVLFAENESDCALPDDAESNFVFGADKLNECDTLSDVESAKSRRNVSRSTGSGESTQNKVQSNKEAKIIALTN